MVVKLREPKLGSFVFAFHNQTPIIHTWIFLRMVCAHLRASDKFHLVVEKQTLTGGENYLNRQTDPGE